MKKQISKQSEIRLIETNHRAVGFLLISHFWLFFWKDETASLLEAIKSLAISQSRGVTFQRFWGRQC